MDIRFVQLLADAGAALDAAMESTESGSKEWDLVLDVRSRVEKLIKFEVTSTWPIF